MRALIVDDSPAARELALLALEAAFEELGYRYPVDVAASGAAALKSIATGDVSVLVVDLHMPDLHGLEVLSFWMQRRPREGRALVVSTKVSERDRDKAIEQGAYRFLEKPVTRELFVDALKGFGGALP